jgi:hypothetical protein
MKKNLCFFLGRHGDGKIITLRMVDYFDTIHWVRFKDCTEPGSDLCWWCGKWRMALTHIFLRCTHQKLQKARKDIWDRPDEEGKIMKTNFGGTASGEI